MHKASLGDMAILIIIVQETSQCLQLCKQNLHQLFIYLLAITEWVYKFLIPKICPVLGSIFDWVIISQGPSLGSPWPSMALHGPQITPN